jgi:hypothetical protein
MADWYVSSVNYAALTQWAATTAYVVGDIRRGLAAPAVTAQHVFRCTTAGTSGGSEPVWGTTNNATTNDGTAVWTCVTGQSTYNWLAPAGTVITLIARIAVGDRCFISSDHAQTQASALQIGLNATSLTATLYMSVNKTGSVPPVPADYLAGASCATTGANSITIEGGARWRGVTFSSGASIRFVSGILRPVWLRDCALVLNNATAGSIIGPNSSMGLIWQNTTVQFGAAGQHIEPAPGSSPCAFDWYGSGSAVVGGTLPTTLFTQAANSPALATIRGVDLSALGSGNNLVSFTSSGSCPATRYTFTNCKLGSGVSVITGSQTTGLGSVVELINCDDANTNYRCERHCSPQGDVTTETTITRTGGANDGTTTFARKMVSTTSIAEFNMPLEGIPMDAWNTATGGAQTATVEIISSGTLTDQDIGLQIEYLGDASSPRSSFGNSGRVTELTTPANVTSSAVAWNSSPATPVKQKLQVAFTPQKVGLVRGTVILKTASKTVYVDPVMDIA